MEITIFYQVAISLVKMTELATFLVNAYHFQVTRQLQEYMDNFKAPYINDVQNYERLQKIGQGTFGWVFSIARIPLW